MEINVQNLIHDKKNHDKMEAQKDNLSVLRAKEQIKQMNKDRERKFKISKEQLKFSRKVPSIGEQTEMIERRILNKCQVYKKGLKYVVFKGLSQPIEENKQEELYERLRNCPDMNVLLDYTAMDYFETDSVLLRLGLTYLNHYACTYYGVEADNEQPIKKMNKKITQE